MNQHHRLIVSKMLVYLFWYQTAFVYVDKYLEANEMLKVP